MLNNPLYRGEYIWNRSKWVKDPTDGKKKAAQRPEHEWVKPAPDLRIINDELWLQVKQRQVGIRKLASVSVLVPKKQHATGSSPRYLLSGLLKCGECGSNYVVCGVPTRYVCATHTNGGKHACANSRKAFLTTVEQKVLMVLKEELTAPAYFAEFKREVRRLIDAKQKSQATDGFANRKRLAKLDAEVENLINVVGEVGISPSLRQALATAEAEREQRRAATAVDDHQIDRVVTMIPRMTETFRRLVADFEAMPRHHGREVPALAKTGTSGRPDDPKRRKMPGS
jgi:site-specific DNA recombinase